MFTMLRKLHRARLLTVPGLLWLLEAAMTTGANLMGLLRVAAQLFPERVAVTDEQERLTYRELYCQAEALATALHAGIGIRPRRKVAIACRNHGAAVKAIFAFARLGTHLYFVNPEMSADQLLALEERLRFDFYVYDDPLAPVFADPPLRGRSLPSYHATDPCIDRLASRPGPARARLKKVRAGNIVLMTGGTTGQPKSASRKPSFFDFLPPFVALLTRINLDECRTVYLATPLYHSFGVGSLLMGIILGAEMYLTRRFEAARACELIARHKIEVVTVVPLMLQRMLNRDAGALSSLRCVITGSDTLSPALARESLDRLGPTLFNLYGSSEGGIAIMADPEELRRKPDTIGKPIWGVRIRLLNEANQEVGVKEVGRLCVHSAWTVSKKNWIDTGDLAFRDADGDYFLCGRADDMIVSGGENVYPIELENVLQQHPDVAAVAVIGIPDAEFGQRLKAVVAPKKGRALDRQALLDWLRPQVSRHQMPAVVELRDELPYTPVGKPDKRALRGS
jgi:acyl-CoA synthetase (AMP-forming)/AMP-acid ligase II